VSERRLAPPPRLITAGSRASRSRRSFLVAGLAAASLLAGAQASAAPALTAPPAGGDGDLQAALVARARAAKLADRLGWRRLLHYRSKWLGGVESDADGPAFFLSPRGKTDPAAELEATLAGFFAPQPADPGLQHPQCQFPARLAWLASELGFDPASLPRRTCEGLDTFRERLQPRSITLVFSSYYLNNPASSFGHTFLRVNKGDAAEGGRRFELVDYGVDFAAVADTGNAVLYAVKGLTGLFQGRWNHYPYFYKVREYADYESRDLWEYDLELSAREVELLAGHLWELGSTWFDYYYLTENCSYGILAALEAAAPRLELLRHLGPIVIPADTVKALYEMPGLVRSVHFRPSIRTQFLARTAALTGPERGALDALMADERAPLGPLPPAAGARALDAALDWVDFAHARELLDNVPTPAALVKQRLMERRAGLAVQSEELVIPLSRGQQPQLGHGSIRTGVGGGASSRSGALAVYDFRLALHDLADPKDGYPDLAQIEFLPTRLRYEARSNALSLERTLLVDVVSLNDYTPFDRHVSWRAALGADTVRDAGCPGCLAGKAQVGGGLARSVLGGAVTAYALTDAELAWAPRLSGLDGASARLALGPSGGLRLRLGDRVSLLGEAGWRYLPWAAPRSTFELRATARLHLGRFSLWAEAGRWPLATEGLAGISLFL
jgi:hypothetical protein